jgi:hypothetical protein
MNFQVYHAEDNAKHSEAAGHGEAAHEAAPAAEAKH